MGRQEDDRVSRRLLAMFLAIIAFATCFAADALAANFRLAELGRSDGLHNGSTDVQGTFGGSLLRRALTSNMADDGVIICNVYLEGRIDPGDANRLRSIVQTWRQTRKLDSLRLCLNSPGGSYNEGLLISRLLMDESIGTAVEANAVCASACALIFMAGSASWKGQLNRFLNVNGLVAFHAPYLDPSKMVGQTYSAADVAASAYLGLQAVNQLIKLGKDRVPHFFDTDLLSEMLDRGPDEVFAIDTVIKAIRYRVALYGAMAPPISAETLVNACVNYFYSGSLQLTIHELNRVKATKFERFPQGLRAQLDVAPGGGSCVIDLVTNGDRVSQWIFHETYLGNRTFAGPTGIILAYWYLFPGVTPIANVPRPER